MRPSIPPAGRPADSSAALLPPNIRAVPDREFVFGSIFLLANRLQLAGDGVIPGVSLKQWFLLMMISKMETPRPCVNEIAAFTGVTRQNVAKMLATLERGGYVCITPSPADARARTVALTGRCTALFEQYNPAGQAFLERLYRGLSPEQLAAVSSVFCKLFANLSQMEKGSAT